MIVFRNKELRLTAIAYGVCALVTALIISRWDVAAALICFLGFAVAFTLFLLYTQRRYLRISALSAYIEGLCAGRSVTDIRENEEGELSILYTNVYKLASMLGGRSELLKKEKTGLKDVLSDISHQLKTPLTSMTVMIDLLDDDHLPKEKRDEFSQNLKDSLSRMEWLVLSLLKLARLDAEAIVFKPEDVSAADLLRRASQSVEVLLDVKNQTIAAEKPEDVSLHCDFEWTAEALGNILKNAGEHAPEGSVIRVESGENPIYSWISVANPGTGIAPEDMPYLFQRFHRGKSDKPDSVGIGLPMSLAIMQKQDGDIEVKNEYGKGVCFVMKFYHTVV